MLDKDQIGSCCSRAQNRNYTHIRSGRCLWMMAQKASPSLNDADMF